MKKVLLAFDTFKDSISAIKLCEASERILKELSPELEVTQLPLSDGGEGFLFSMEKAFSSLGVPFAKHSLEVRGPLGTLHTAYYGVANQQVGVIELAQTSGLELVPVSMRNPYKTTAHGAGQMISYLYWLGIKELVIGLGGSSTSEGGLSVLFGTGAADFKFQGEVPEILRGEDLPRVTEVQLASSMFEELKVTLACDVTNELLGERGAAKVFGKQKGMQDWLSYERTVMQHAAELLETMSGMPNIGSLKSGGAAGGIAAGIIAAFKKVEVVSGVEYICQAISLDSKVSEFDFLITGEGKYDEQTQGGKVVSKMRNLNPHAFIICGKNETQESYRVYDFVSRFGSEYSMEFPEDCLEKVLRELSVELVVRNDFSSKSED